MSFTSWPTDSPEASSDEKLAQVVEWYTEQVHHGCPPDLSDVCRRYPELADALRDVLPVVQNFAVPGDRVPREIGPYQLTDRIGGGGVGTVYAAVDTRDGSSVAIKLIDVARLTGHQRSRIRREFKLVGQLPDGPFVRVRDVGQTDTCHYLVMDLIDGCNLHQHLDQVGPLSLRDTLRIGIEVADGLAVAHQAGVIHRDIKPSNLMMTGDGCIRIVDFGLAFQADLVSESLSTGIGDQPPPAVRGGSISTDSLPPQTPPSILRTVAGTVLGTISYMAPEQAVDSRDADHRSDIYSLGCTLFHCLTGQPPHAELTWIQCLIAHREQPPPSARQLRRDVPVELDRVLRRCMARRPADRYSSMMDLANSLRKIEQRFEDRPNRPRRLIAILTSAALLLAAAVWFFPSGHRDATEGTSNAGRAVATSPPSSSKIVWTSDRGSRYETVWMAGDERFAHWNYVSDVMFSRKGHEIFSGSFDGQLVRWDSSTGERIASYGSDQWIADIESVGHDAYLISGHGGGDVMVWPTSGDPAVGSLRISDAARWPVLAASNDGRWLAIADDHVATIHLHHVDDWRSGITRPRRVLDRGSGAQETALAFGPDDDSLLAVISPDELVEFDLRSSAVRQRYASTGKAIRSIASHPDRPRFATLDIGGQLTVYETNQSEPLIGVLAHDRPGRRVVLDRPTSTWLTSGEDRTIRRWDAETLVLREVVAERTRSNWGLAVDPAGDRWVSCGTDQRLMFWPADAGAPRWMGGKAWAVRFLQPDDPSQMPRLIVGGADGSIEVSDLASGDRRELPLHHEAEISDLAICPNDPNRFASASRDGTVRVWDLSDGSSERVAEHPGSAWCVAFSPDGRRLATGGWDRVVRVTDLATGRSWQTLGHRHMVNGVAWIDDQRLVSIGGDRVDPDQPSFAVLWDVGHSAITERARYEAGAALYTVCVDADRVWIGGSWGAGRIGLNTTTWRADDDDGSADPVCWSLSVRGSTRVSGLGDGTLRLAHADTGEGGDEERLQLGPEAGEVHAVDVSADERWIAAACGDGTLWVLRRNGKPNRSDR